MRERISFLFSVGRVVISTFHRVGWGVQQLFYMMGNMMTIDYTNWEYAVAGIVVTTVILFYTFYIIPRRELREADRARSVEEQRQGTIRSDVAIIVNRAQKVSVS